MSFGRVAKKWLNFCTPYKLCRLLQTRHVVSWQDGEIQSQHTTMTILYLLVTFLVGFTHWTHWTLQFMHSVIYLLLNSCIPQFKQSLIHAFLNDCIYSVIFILLAQIYCSIRIKTRFADRRLSFAGYNFV